MASDGFDFSDAEEYFDAVEPRIVAQSKGKAPVTSLADSRANASNPSHDGEAAVKKPRVKLPAVSLADFDEEEVYEGSAMDQCLALPEMLERILQYVPPLQLYPLQRVNTLFRDLIWRSISIRRHMFMIPHEKYFVRGELNRLFGPKSRSKLRLATAPFHLELYADRTGRGVHIKIHKGKLW
ncbi:hypothetical protein CBER1_01417 [Lecanosticta acicola]|uniref:F-box domain-containing protein n=1 Tax=Lecanosticta acicola TaxID=111012 RepID=A0AAI9E8W4_9PEZI|nr:hypothetical protein CBER1_01417 [Lecanosticta acicola]